MSAIIVDIESDGPIPGDYSMICFGAVVLDKQLDKTFYAQLKPISDNWQAEALAISGFNRDDCLGFADPADEMHRFARWLADNSSGSPWFFSDNNGFDWQFINWYFHHFTGDNPFGHSSTNIGSLYKGLVSNMSRNFKHLRKTAHSHHPVDDALGNAEALLYMITSMGLKIRLDLE